MMTRRERLRRCFCHEELDRPGVYSRDGFPADDPTYDRLKAYLKEHTELKRGWGPGPLTPPPPAEYSTEAHSRDWKRCVTVLKTPAGDLRSTYLASLKGQPGMSETYLLKDRSDAEKYLSLPIHEPAGDLSSFADAEKEIGEAGIVDVDLGSNPAGAVASLCGSETFAIMSITDRDALHALCEREMQVLLKRVKFLLERRIGPYFSICGEEYIVPPLHGPRDFWDFNVRYDKPAFDLIHEAGARVHVHCHASVKKVLAGFIEMGVDVLHPFEAPPMGDITPQEAKAMARGKLCLEGNIQIADMYEGTPDDVREQTRALMETCFDDRRGLIVSPTASPYIRGAGETCFPQYKAMIDAVLEWKQ
jgi:hypothetical protein